MERAAVAGKRTKAHQGEFVGTYYGVSQRTKRVEAVWKRRDGQLSKTLPNGVTTTHYVGPGRLDEAEIVIVWGLTDVFHVAVGSENSDWVKRRIAELQAKADAIED